MTDRLVLPQGFFFLGGQFLVSLLYGILLIYWSHWSGSSLQDELLVFLLPPVFYAAYQYQEKRIYIPSGLVGAAIGVFALWNMDVGLENSLKTLIIVAFSSMLSAEVVYRMNRNRILLEMELNKSQSQLNAIFNGVSDAIYTKDRNGCIVAANRACSVILEIPQEEILGKSAFELWDPQTALAIHKHDQEIWEGKSNCHEYHVCINGRGRIMQFTKVPLLDDNGNINGICGIARDVTEIRRAERERDEMIVKLCEAIGNIKQLSGLLPICSSCKKIRDDKGYWTQVEEYIHTHSDAQITHGLCPDCAKAYFPEDYAETA